MKRTALKRRTPLARGAGPKRGPMKRYRKPSSVAKADAMAAAIVHARGCCAVGAKYAPHMRACGGPLEQHHARGRGKGFRWRTESHLLLCGWHHRNSPHLSAHGATKAFAFWLAQAHPEIAAMPNVPETAEQAVKRMQNAEAQRPAVVSTLPPVETPGAPLGAPGYSRSTP